MHKSARAMLWDAGISLFGKYELHSTCSIEKYLVWRILGESTRHDVTRVWHFESLILWNDLVFIFTTYCESQDSTAIERGAHIQLSRIFNFHHSVHFDTLWWKIRHY